MSLDLLGGVTGAQKGYSQSNDLEYQAEEISLTPRGQSRPPQNGLPEITDDYHDEMEEFFQEVDAIQKSLEELDKSLEDIYTLHEKSKTYTRSDKVKQAREQMRDDVLQVSKIRDSLDQVAAVVKKQIEKLQKDQDGDSDGSASSRTKEQMIASLTKRLTFVVKDFANLRGEIHDDYKEIVRRRVFTITGEEPEDDTVENLIETGESEQVFQQAILEQGRGQIMDVVVEIEERHEAIKELEQGLVALHEIFMDMATLVEQQGELLLNIENSVASAKEYTAKGLKEIHTARELQKALRKKTCCLIVTLLIIVGVIVLIVFVAA